MAAFVATWEGDVKRIAVIPDPGEVPFLGMNIINPMKTAIIGRW
jgi:hypothetical protein